MLDVMLTGVGGQGTVLAAKMLAQAAQEKGWHVRTAETIGMAQRGGSVVSHVRMGDEGEEVYSPLIAKGSADMVIAFEPGEGARVLPYLKRGGILVTAETAIQPVTAALGGEPYRGADVVRRLRDTFEGSASRLVVVHDGRVLSQLGNRKALNTVLLASAVATQGLPLGVDDLRAAVKACVKSQFVELNLRAIELAVR